DYWSAGGGVTALAPGREATKASQRFHPELASAAVEHLGWRRLVFEMRVRLSKRSGWDTILRRNALFQRVMIRRLDRRKDELRRAAPGIFFSYSYAALDLIRWFREIGWHTALGQIDPGIHEEDTVAAELARHPGLATDWTRAPARYWQLWREECALSDIILVNSEWSREALVSSGIEAGKIDIIPLAFEQSASTNDRVPPPDRFTRERPLRVLFLGQLTVRKGVHLALGAARKMRGEHVRWNFVGPADMDLPADLRGFPNVLWSGPVSREATAQLYREADLFILPTLSDGFALTQLEAQARGLPILASKFCGDVVRDGVNGLIIDPLSSDAIVERLRRVLDDPRLLARMIRASAVDARFSLETLARNLEQVESRLIQARP
ncbi:MAG: glycosyltransferase family 4 protein, partial [Opitutaceae bacterium]